LWWRKERRVGRRVVAQGTWIVIDGGKHHATGCFAGENQKAQRFLAAYIAEKYSPDRRLKDIESIDVADVLSVYYEDCREKQANKPKIGTPTAITTQTTYAVRRMPLAHGQRRQKR